MSLKPRQTRQIIVIQRPVLWVSVTLLIIGLTLAGIWGAYEYGRYQNAPDNDDVDAYIIDLQHQLEKSREEFVESQRQASMLERNRQIDDDASRQLKGTLVEVQNEVLSLKKELVFYKSVVAPEKGDRNLIVQMVQVKPDVSGGYYYKVMVSQRGRNDKYARGSLDINIDGVVDDKNKEKTTTLKLSDVSNETKKTLKFGFKYFQIFEGVMTFPEGFVAEQFRVSVKPKTAKMKPVDEQYSWSDLMTGGA